MRYVLPTDGTRSALLQPLGDAGVVVYMAARQLNGGRPDLVLRVADRALLVGILLQVVDAHAGVVFLVLVLILILILNEIKKRMEIDNKKQIQSVN